MNNERAIVATNDSHIVPAVPVSLMPADQMLALLAEYQHRQNTFRGFLSSVIRPGVHYGFPPGIRVEDKPGYKSRESLYKAGAEVLMHTLCLRAEWHMDSDTWKMMGEKPGLICYRAVLINEGSWFFPHKKIGDVVAEGRGAYQEGDRGMKGNTAIKMAEKRAMVDAVINALGLSDLFTQDLEDYAPEPSPKAQQGPDAVPAPTRNERAQRAESGKVTPGARVWQSWSECAKSKDMTQFKSWVSSRWASVAEGAPAPTPQNPITEDQADRLIILIQEEFTHV